MKNLTNICLFAILSFCFLGCDINPAREYVLFDFESPSELDQLEWSCHTMYSLSDEHPSHGAKSLKLELFPSARPGYPGFTPILRKKDWGDYKVLSFDIYNPQEKELPVSLRMDDRKYPEYKDRFNKTFMLHPGLNNISIPFDAFVTSGTQRQLNLGSIHKFLIFMTAPEKRTVLYIDYIRLIK